MLPPDRPDVSARPRAQGARRRQLVVHADADTATLHLALDAPYAGQTEWGRPLVDSPFTLAFVTGQSVSDVSQNVMANLGWDEVRLPAPVFEGDTIDSESEVLEVRDPKSRMKVGVVTVATRSCKQDGVVVTTFKRTPLVSTRDPAPSGAGRRPGG